MQLQATQGLSIKGMLRLKPLPPIASIASIVMNGRSTLSRFRGCFIYHADKRFVEAGLADGEKFAAHLPVYPSCQAQFRTLTLTNAPILFLVGELDDYTPMKYCLTYVERIVAARIQRQDKNISRYLSCLD